MWSRAVISAFLCMLSNVMKLSTEHVFTNSIASQCPPQVTQASSRKLSEVEYVSDDTVINLSLK